MNLIEKARKRMEEKQNLAKQYSEKCQLLTQLSNELKIKSKNKLADLRANSGINEKQNLIKTLTEEVERKEKEVKKIAEIYSKKLSKRMGIDALRDQADNMFRKMYSDEISFVFKLNDLTNEMLEITGKKHKVKIYFDYPDVYTNTAEVVMKVKNVPLNLETNLTELENLIGDNIDCDKYLNVKKILNLELSIRDTTLLNFFEEETKNKTQQVVKQALINLSNKQELNNENNKNID